MRSSKWTNEVWETTSIEYQQIIYPVSFRRKSSFSEGEWGTDADGNRAETRTFLDDDTFDEVEIEGVAFRDCELVLQKLALLKIQSFMRSNPPDPGIEFEQEPEE